VFLVGLALLLAADGHADGTKGGTPSSASTETIRIPNECLPPDAEWMKGKEFVLVPKNSFDAQVKFIRRSTNLLHWAEEVIRAQQEEIQELKSFQKQPMS
jgi:hypothetical protein